MNKYKIIRKIENNIKKFLKICINKHFQYYFCQSISFEFILGDTNCMVFSYI
jgi:hypothetical protein